ncbi:MAG: hypothetical protein ABI779_23695 [Acidobacteriota bacterium]
MTTTLTHAAGSFAEARHHPLTMTFLVVLFWAAAGVLVVTARVELDSLSTTAGVVTAIVAIAVAASCYMRLCARNCGSSHALGVGIVWLGLALVTEITLTTRLGHGWFALLGSPERPVIRDVLLLTWVFAPAMFAHRESSLP